MHFNCECTYQAKILDVPRLRRASTMACLDYGVPRPSLIRYIAKTKFHKDLPQANS